jgi:seryl-tRNA synthetase
MIDIKYIRENSDIIKKGIEDKQLKGTVDIDKLLELDAQYTDLLRKVETHRALKNQLSQNISKVEDQERKKLIDEATKVKDELVEMEHELDDLNAQIKQMLLWVPNPPAVDVPVAENEEGNEVIKQVGNVPQFDFEVKDHVELGKSLNILDTERGTKIGGFRGFFLKNEGVLLEMALINYAVDFMKKQGFEVLSVPWMVKPEFFTGTGYLPWGEEDLYKVQDELYLIGTAEVPVTSYYSGEILNEEDLPIKMVGVSPCFRREVGSYGKDTRGVVRVHQFTKVEQVVLVPADEEISRQWHEKMLGFVEQILQSLGLSYQVLLMCSGDMGAGQRKKYDVETWFPSQNKYRETHSDSYFLDFQSRRLNIKYKTKDGNTSYVHTLNNTVAASPRLLAAIMENYQQADGSIKVPDVLQKYIGMEKISPTR